MQNSNHSYFKGAMLCLMATLSWGIMFPVMTHALRFIDPFNFTVLRYTLAGAIFLWLLYVKEGQQSFAINGNHVLLWLFGSAGFAGFGFLVFLGQKIAGPSGALSASIMMATMPLLGLFVNWGIKGIKPPIYSFGFIGMSFIGVLLVMTKGHIMLVFIAPGNYFANILMIAGALCWVLYTIGGSYFPKWSPIKYTAMSTLYGLPTIYIITFILIKSHMITVPAVGTLWHILPELIYMAFIAGFVGVLCWNQGNRIITPINGVLFMDVVPITAFLISTVEGIAPNEGQIIGVFLTAVALILNNLYQRQRLKLAAGALAK